MSDSLTFGSETRHLFRSSITPLSGCCGPDTRRDNIQSSKDVSVDVGSTTKNIEIANYETTCSFIPAYSAAAVALVASLFIKACPILLNPFLLG